MYYKIDKVIDSVLKNIHKQKSVKNIVQQSVKEDGKYIYFCPVNSLLGINDMDTIMKEMMEYLSEKYPEKRIVFYKTTSEMGETGKYNRECFYNEVDLECVDVSDTIRIMFAKNQYNEGVHAPNIDGVFLGRGTASDIVALEQIGRGLSVRGDTSKKIEEYNGYSLDELREIVKSRGIKVTEDVTKEYLIELLVAPMIIDLADNISFLQELETNLKDRIREKKNNGEPLTLRQIKILEVWSTLDVEQKDLYEALMNLREQVQAYTWDDWYDLAFAYYQEHGHSEIPYDFKTTNGINYDENGFKLGQWCDRQRQNYRKGNLGEEKRRRLEQIKFRFDVKDNEKSWDNWYKLALAYYKEHGHSEVPQFYKTINGKDPDEKGVSLGIWCVSQREKYKKGTLSEDKIQKLTLIQFRFETQKRTMSWDDWYRLALVYYNKYGDSETPTKFKTINGKDYDEKGVALGNWIKKQREKYSSSSKERQQKLKAIELRLKTKEQKKKPWDDWYKLALAYYNRYNHSNIPQNFKTINGKDYNASGYALGAWCDTQRQEQDKLVEERRQKLNLIRFRFENKKDIEWEKNYQLALAYYKEHGHSEISSNFKTINGKDYDENGVSLGKWCDKQRQNYGKGTLKEEKRRKLEQIEFRFETKDYDEIWEKWYQLLISYYNKHGHSNVPQHFKTFNGKESNENGVTLGIWCNRQRQNKDKLSEERRQKLELIEFRFNTREENEENKKNLCSKYGIEYDKHKILKKMSYQELYAKIMYLIDNGYSLLDGDKLHEIFSMSNENMILKYMISKEELITNYYINKKGKKV
jgi:hypothetical protein